MNKKKKLSQRLASWLDVIFLLPGCFFVVFGTFKAFGYVGFIVLGACLIAMSVIFGLIQKKGGGGS